MHSIRAAPRVLRPHLSLRYQYLHRTESTASNPITPTISTSPSKPTFLQRYRNSIVWISIGLTTGLVIGNFASHYIAPPPMPEAGTHEDRVLMADLNKRIDGDFKVKVLRGKCLGVTKQLKGEQGGWVEVVPSPIEAEKRLREDSLVGNMQGAKGLGVERIFWDRGEHRLVAVIWFGGALCGWPGVTHGGAIATTLSDKLALAAALANGANGDLAAAAIPQRLPGTGNHAKMLAPIAGIEEPKELSLSYVKPSTANSFYVIRVSPALSLEQDPAHIVPSEPEGGHEYEATLETLDAKICVKAKARFEPVQSISTAERVEQRLDEVAKSSYEQFKQWMWASRQAASSA